MSKEQDHIWWFGRGEEYLRMAAGELARQMLQSSLSHLQHAAEFFFKAAIRFHSGDHPHIRNPYTLLHICRLYLPAVDSIFPRNSLEEILLFSLLNPYRFIPAGAAQPSLHTIAKLHKRVTQLKNLIKQQFPPS